MIKSYSFSGSDLPEAGQAAAELCQPLHFLDFNDKFKLCYSPLVSRLLLMSADLAADISRGHIPEGMEAELARSGLLVPKGYRESMLKVGESRPAASFVVTRDCNLACKYCMVCAGDKKGSISIEQAKALIDYVFERNGKEQIDFYGGEPTMRMDLIRQIVDYAKAKRPGCTFFISTNGIASRQDMEYFVKHDFSIKISYDGSADIQDAQRPLAGGSQSSGMVEENILSMPQEKRFLHVTVSKYNVSKLSQILYHFRQLQVGLVKVELLSENGRAADPQFPQNSRPEKGYIIDNFMKMRELAYDWGIRLDSTSLNPIGGVKHEICGTGDQLWLLPDGSVSSCCDAQEKTDDLDLFIIGSAGKGEVSLNREKTQKLSQRSANNLEECRDCLLRFNCAGDCALRAFKQNHKLMSVDDELCDIKKDLAAAYFRYIADRFMIGIKPYIESFGKEMAWAGFFSRFTLGKDMVRLAIDAESIRQGIEDLPGLGTKRPTPLLVLLDLDGACSYDQADIMSLMDGIRDNGVYARLLRPIRRCMVSGGSGEWLQELNRRLKEMQFPIDCMGCVSMFSVGKGGEVTFCNGVRGKKAITNYADREELHSEFLENKRPAGRCSSCIFLRRGACEGQACDEAGMFADSANEKI